MVDLGPRAADDAWLDAQRNPQAFLAHAAIRPGDRVAVFSTAGGYSTEIIARAVGPTGAVFAQDAPFAYDIATVAGERRLARRLADPQLAHVRFEKRPYGDPLPPTARNLDKVFLSHAYHDVVWWCSDEERRRMLEAAADHLRPGGEMIVVDHAANVGRSTRDVDTIHRVEERIVQQEMARAGFELVRTADYLRYADNRDWFVMDQTHPHFGKDDRFVHAYRRP